LHFLPCRLVALFSVDRHQAIDAARVVSDSAMAEKPTRESHARPLLSLPVHPGGLPAFYGRRSTVESIFCRKASKTTENKKHS
jgi:hypothetical protein